MSSVTIIESDATRLKEVIPSADLAGAILISRAELVERVQRALKGVASGVGYYAKVREIEQLYRDFENLLTDGHLYENRKPLYVTISVAEVNKATEAGLDIIYGDSADILVKQLEERFSSPDGTTRIHCLSQYKSLEDKQKTRTESNYTRYKEYKQATRGCWVVLNSPIVTITDKDNAAIEVAAWNDVLNQGVLVQAEQLPDDMRMLADWRDAGFSVRDRAFEMLWLRYNPHVQLVRESVQKQNAYTSLLRGYFDYKPLRELRDLFSNTGFWPWADSNKLQKFLELARCNVSPFGEYSEAELALPKRRRPLRHTGKDRSRRGCAVLAAEIVYLLSLQKRFCPEAKHGWWRSCNRGYLNYSVLLANLLPHLYGVEQLLRQVAAKQAAIGEIDGDEEQYDPGSFRDLRKFCRWLRAECRELNIALPAKPRPPRKKTTAKRKRKAKRKNSRSKRRVAAVS